MSPPPRRSRRAGARSGADLVLGPSDTTLLDIVDNVLNKGVVLTGDLTLGLAKVDLVYARLSVLLCAADRVGPADATARAERSPAARRRRAGRGEKRRG